MSATVSSTEPVAVLAEPSVLGATVEATIAADGARPRDTQRKAAYRWEQAVYADQYAEERLSEEQTREYVARVAGDLGIPLPPTSFTCRRNAYELHGAVSFTKGGDRRVVILHELAHVLTSSGEGHGPQWIACYAALVERYLGAWAEDALPQRPEVEITKFVNGEISYEPRDGAGWQKEHRNLLTGEPTDEHYWFRPSREELTTKRVKVDYCPETLTRWQGTLASVSVEPSEMAATLPDLNARAAEINRLFEASDDYETKASRKRWQASDLDRTATNKRWEAGAKLNEAKLLVPHGQWLPWLKANIKRSPRDCQKCMNMAGAEDPAAALKAERERAREGMADLRSNTANTNAVSRISEPEPQSAEREFKALCAAYENASQEARDLFDAWRAS
jgi:hypothetical protein